MIYFSLSVQGIESTVYFLQKYYAFSMHLEIPDLFVIWHRAIPDLHETGSEQHKELFGLNTHPLASILIHHGESKNQNTRTATKYNVNHDLAGNIAGRFLNLREPSDHENRNMGSATLPQKQIPAFALKRNYSYFLIRDRQISTEVSVCKQQNILNRCKSTLCPSSACDKPGQTDKANNG